MSALRVARALVVTMYAYMSAYRAELILWALSSSLPFILLGLWSRAAEHGDFGYTPEGMARYFLAVFLVRQLTVVWVVWEFEQDLIHGRLSHQLLMPLDPVWRYVAGHVGERGARLPFSLLIVAGVLLVLPETRFVPTWQAVLSAGLAITVGFALRFLIQWTFAMLAFWTERASSVDGIWNLFYIFLSGLIAPLDVFPPAVRTVAEYTPFPWLVFWPAHILTGQAELELRPFLIIGAWALVFVVVNRVLWRRGLKHYSGMGA